MNVVDADNPTAGTYCGGHLYIARRPVRSATVVIQRHRQAQPTTRSELHFCKLL